MFATYRPKVEHSILFVKTMNILKDENFFGGTEVLKAVLGSHTLRASFYIAEEYKEYVPQKKALLAGWGSQVWEIFLFTIPIL